jgi:hypothetical protein
MIRSGTLEIFCVDNKTYQQAAAKNDIKPVKTSHIPDIRRFCFSMPAIVQAADARYSLIQLSEIFNSTQIWIDPTKSSDTYFAFLETVDEIHVKVNKHSLSLFSVGCG